MNPRIRELAEQAAESSSCKPGLGNEHVQKYFQEFAELIVKECMSINIQRLFSEYEGDTHRVAHNNALLCAWGDMQEHFGVEE